MGIPVVYVPNDQRIMGIILRYVCWSTHRPPLGIPAPDQPTHPPPPLQTPKSFRARLGSRVRTGRPSLYMRHEARRSHFCHTKSNSAILRRESSNHMGYREYGIDYTRTWIGMPFLYPVVAMNYQNISLYYPWNRNTK